MMASSPSANLKLSESASTLNASAGDDERTYDPNILIKQYRFNSVDDLAVPPDITAINNNHHYHSESLSSSTTTLLTDSSILLQEPIASIPSTPLIKIGHDDDLLTLDLNPHLSSALPGTPLSFASLEVNPTLSHISTTPSTATKYLSNLSSNPGFALYRDPQGDDDALSDLGDMDNFQSPHTPLSAAGTPSFSSSTSSALAATAASTGAGSPLAVGSPLVNVTSPSFGTHLAPPSPFMMYNNHRRRASDASTIGAFSDLEVSDNDDVGYLSPGEWDL
jgi:hypothetical protein